MIEKLSEFNISILYITPIVIKDTNTITIYFSHPQIMINFCENISFGRFNTTLLFLQSHPYTKRSGKLIKYFNIASPDILNTDLDYAVKIIIPTEDIEKFGQLLSKYSKDTNLLFITSDKNYNYYLSYIECFRGTSIDYKALYKIKN